MKRWMGGGVFVVGLILIFEVFSSCGGGAGNGTDGLIGLLDSTFGTGGVAVYSVDSVGISGMSVALQSDGRALVAGWDDDGMDRDLLLFRFTTDGTLDTTFGTDGVARYDGGNWDYGRSVTVQTDGKILVAGTINNGTNWDLVLLRFTYDGTLDTAFGTGGAARYDGGSDDQGHSVALQSDGKALVAGWSSSGTDWDLVLVRFTMEGNLDGTFGTGGVARYDNGFYDEGHSVAIQANGKAMVTGMSENEVDEDLVLVRFTADGVLDPAFGTAGAVRYDSGFDDIGYSVALQADGRALAAGERFKGTDWDLLVVRFTADGTLDSSFGTGGVAVYDGGWDSDCGYSIALQGDRKILVAGMSENEDDYDLVLVRFTADGALDPAFGTAGAVRYDSGSYDTGRSLALQSDGKALVAGVTGPSGEPDLLLSRFE